MASLVSDNIKKDKPCLSLGYIVAQEMYALEIGPWLGINLIGSCTACFAVSLLAHFFAIVCSEGTHFLLDLIRC